jgi:hypothetical protein
MARAAWGVAAGADRVGAKKLQVLLRDEQQVDLPVRTIHRILQRHESLREGVPGAAPQRFERSQPNELWQVVTKGQYPLARGECHPLSILDDLERFTARPGISRTVRTVSLATL